MKKAAESPHLAMLEMRRMSSGRSCSSRLSIERDLLGTKVREDALANAQRLQRLCIRDLELKSRASRVHFG